MTRLGLAFILLGIFGCGSPTTPAVATPSAVALAGQSNAILLRPALSELVTVIGAGDRGATPISCWSATGDCWRDLHAALLGASVSALVWWQGESDRDNSAYGAALADLVARVRAATRRPQLPIVILQWGETYSGARNGAQTQSLLWAALDRHAVVVPTIDLEYRSDGIHMTDQGYRDVSARVVAVMRNGEAR